MEKAETTIIPIDNIYPNDLQPRRDFDGKKLEDLSDSIRRHGLIQPLLVQKKHNGFMIVAGERRYRASVMAGLDKLPCLVWDGGSSRKVMELALVENIQREDLNPIEEAIAYKELSEKYGLTQEQIAGAMGKSRPYITNTVRLLNLSDKTMKLIREGRVSAGHGKALLKIYDTNLQEELADRILDEGLSVRATEKLADLISEKPGKRSSGQKSADPFIKNMQESLINILGTKVSITQGKGKGKIEIEYYSEGELEQIFNTIIGDNED